MIVGASRIDDNRAFDCSSLFISDFATSTHAQLKDVTEHRANAADWEDLSESRPAKQFPSILLRPRKSTGRISNESANFITRNSMTSDRTVSPSFSQTKTYHRLGKQHRGVHDAQFAASHFPLSAWRRGDCCRFGGNTVQRNLPSESTRHLRSPASLDRTYPNEVRQRPARSKPASRCSVPSLQWCDEQIYAIFVNAPSANASSPESRPPKCFPSQPITAAHVKEKLDSLQKRERMS
jgi:hypothetical protein